MMLSERCSVATRSDAGSVRATERDVLALSWVVEMYAMPVDLIEQLTGATPGAVRQMTWRWRRAGWVETARLGAGPMWVWATAAGIERFGAHPYVSGTPSAARLRHIRAVAVARMWLMDQVVDPASAPSWVSERDLRWQLGQVKGADGARSHVPDAEVEFNAPDGVRRRQAIEVELTPKTVVRTLAIMQQLISTGIGLDGGAAYRSVLYLVSKEARPIVERARQELPEEMQERISVRDHPEEV